MRALVFALLVAGCGPDSYEYNAVAAAGKASELCDATQARADTLEKQVASLTAQLNMVNAQLATATAARAQPHLVVAATGEDLGLYVGSNTAVRDINGVALAVKYDTPAALSFDGPDCTGNAFGGDAVNAASGVVGPTGTIFRVSPDTAAFTARSFYLYADLQFTCYNRMSPNDTSGNTAIDTGVKAVLYRPSELTISLR